MILLTNETFGGEEGETHRWVPVPFLLVPIHVNIFLKTNKHLPAPPHSVRLQCYLFPVENIKIAELICWKIEFSFWLKYLEYILHLDKHLK